MRGVFEPGVIDASNDARLAFQTGTMTLTRPPKQFRTIAALAAIVLFWSASSALAAPPDGEILTNNAFFRADGIGTQATFVSVEVENEEDDDGGGGGGGLTDIELGCSVEPGCETAFIRENSTGQALGPINLVGGSTSVEYSLEVGDERFEIVGNTLQLVDGASINFESEPEVLLFITATGSDGDVLSTFFQVPVVDVNEAPFNLGIDNNFVPDGEAGATIGSLFVSDVDEGDSISYDVFGDDRFEIVDGVLKLVDGVALAEGETVPLTLLATDSGGLDTRSVVLISTDPEDREIPPTPSQIQLLAPNTAGGMVEFAPAACSPPTDGSVPDSRGLVGPPPLDSPIQVDEVDAYAVGDAILVGVRDADQNFRPLVKDSVSVRLDVTVTGDSELVILTESAVDSGYFVGYVFTTSRQSSIDDCVLTVASNAQVSATYTDPTDGSDVVSNIAEISPVGLVFNDQTGDPVDGVILTLVEVGSGQPAEVRGDGPEFALYPSAVVSGETVQDRIGAIYDHASGEYRFPAIPDGEYRLEIFNLEEFVISGRSDDELQALPRNASPRALDISDGTYALSAASRGQVFTVSQGSLPRIDIPVRPVVPDSMPPLTPADISFYQYSPIPGVGETFNVQQTLCVADQTRSISELRDVAVPVPGLVNLVETDVIKAGQPVFVIVRDANRNIDPTVRERVLIEVSVPSTDDREFLELTETEPDSGEFIGYIQSAEGTNQIGSCELGVEKNESIFTRYADAYDNSDVAETRVLVDPFGVLFSTNDGTRIDGVTITLVNAATGQPAEVFGDGPTFAPYPSTVVTGTGAVDEAGVEYTFPDGGYRFPFVVPGDYRLEVSGLPAEYLFPSVVDDSTIQQLPGAPYALRSGSRGGDFEVPVGPALNIDLPVDKPAANLLVAKSASKELVAVGDFVQYRISVSADVAGPVGEVSLVDNLPLGFRYERGSLRVNGESYPEPAIDDRGRTLTIPMSGNLAEPVEVTYVAAVTVGADPGEAINTATVVGDLIASSNTATARVLVTNDLFRDKATLMGRVTLGECDSEEGEAAEGMAGVRIYLEDGSFVTTDDNGFWHIEGIEPGSHVVQLDVASLEERYEPSACQSNTRFAGSRYSQFVDVRGGTVWRADFVVQQRPDPVATVELKQTLSRERDGLWVLLEAGVKEGEVFPDNAKLVYNAPKGWRLVEGTAELNGEAASRQKTIVGSVWELGDLDESRALRFAIVPVEPPKQDNRFDVMAPRFETRSASLGETDRRELDRLIREWRKGAWSELTVVGHSDNVPIAPWNRDEFESNAALSKARAQSVADYIGARLDVPVVNVVGAGDRYPVASNETAEGRRQNRRVEMLLRADNSRVVSIESALAGESTARLAFESANTPRGRTELSKLSLEQLKGGFQRVASTVQAEAVGSWDLPADLDQVAEARDPNVQGLMNVVDGETYSNRTMAVRLDLDSRLTPRLVIDGEEIPRSRIGFSKEDPDTGKTIYSYIGVNLGDPGTHSMTLEGLDPFGNARFEQTVGYTMTGLLYSVEIVETDGNVADGTSPVRIKVDMRDRSGNQIKSGQTLLLESDSLGGYTRNLSLTELSDINDPRYVRVNRDGEILMNPVTVSGLYRGILRFEEQEVDFEVFVEPEKREWIMVGIAEGSVAHNRLSGNMEAIEQAGLEDEFSTDGRLAFYAKGQVKGEYILTVAYDSDKEKRNAVRQQIDPNQYYTIYGDQTQTQYDAESNEKLYLKLERGQFYALFGDFSTGLSENELSNYSRRLTGLKTEFDSDRFEVVAFVSESDQAFVKDEIRGDGTSGLYQLSSSEIVRNSEQITIETRDRFRNEEILDAVTLRRFVDYDIDYEAGTLFFKQPIPSQDTAFNPVFIVADYETPGRGSDRLDAGGRVAYKFSDDAEVGLSVLHEGVENRESDLVGLDATWQIDDVTEARAEIATSESQRDDGTKASGDAVIAEVTRRTSEYEATAYARQIDQGFGLGQQRGGEIGTRRIGAEGRYYIGDNVEISGEVYEQKSLETDATEKVASTTVEMDGDGYTLNTGIRSATAEAEGRKQQSNLVTAGGTYEMLDGKLVLNAAGDAPIGGASEAANFPKRLRVGLDYKLTKNVTITAEQEFTWGDEFDTQGTRVGLKTQPWKGGEISTTAQQSFGENGERLAAVAGLRQTWEFNDKWRFDFTVDRSQTIAQQAVEPSVDEPNVLPQAPDLQVTTVYGSSDNEDFTSVTFGSNFRKDAWDWSTRVEYKTSDGEDRINLVSDVIHDLDDGQQLLAQVDIQQSDTEGAERSTADIRLGYAFRPVDSRWTVLNRLDLSRSSNVSNGFDVITQKIVNNLNANYVWTDDTQIALQYGAKYVTDNFDGEEYSGYTDLLGMEVRHDLGARWDLGFHGSMYNSWKADVSDYSYGVSVGHNIAHNVWLSLGFNFEGFSDDDFLGSEYTAKGVYLKYRVKLDQDSLRRARNAFAGLD